MTTLEWRPVENAFNPQQQRDKNGRWTKAASTESSADSSQESQGDISLATPQIILGDVPVHPKEFHTFMLAHGREWTPAKLPKGIPKGTPKECFKNASMLVLNSDDLDYVEGVAYTPKLEGLAFLHAWAVGKDGKVIDNTWDNPDQCRYFGVKYPKDKYLKHIFKTKLFGIFGANRKVAEKVIKDGGLK